MKTKLKTKEVEDGAKGAKQGALHHATRESSLCLRLSNPGPSSKASSKHKNRHCEASASSS